MTYRYHAQGWIAAATVLFFVGCGGKSPDGLIDSARDKLSGNDPAYAIVELKSALEQRPDSAEGRFLLGQALLKTNSAAAAEVEFRKALALRYPDSKVLPALAQSMVAQNEDRKLIGEYGDVSLQDAQAQALLKTAVAKAFANLSNPSQAALAANAALQAVPDHAAAMLLLARLAAADGKYEQASALIQRADKASPNNAEVWVYKGDLALAERGDALEAIPAYEKALSFDASDLNARVNLTALLIRQGDLKGAQTQMATLRKSHRGSGQVAFLDAQLALAEGDLKRATENVQQILKVAPDNVKVLQLAGRIAAGSGSLDAAERAFAKALSLAPDQADARRQLAIIHLRRGDPTRALARLAPLIETGSIDGGALVIAAEAEMALGAYAKAKDLYARAAALNPTDTRSRTKEALADLALGNTDAAVSQLRTISGADKGTFADLALVNAAINAKDFAQALKGLDTMESKRPGQASTVALRGRVQLLMKDEPQARKSLERALSIDPGYLSAAATLAQLDLKDKHPEAARKRFDGVLAQDPKNLGAMVALASLLAAQGAPDGEIVGLLDKAIKANPDEAAPRLILIEHYERIKNTGTALTAAREADAAVPDNPDIIDALGRTQAAAGEREQAILTFQRLATLEPRSIRPIMRTAGVYLAGNQYGSAAQSFRRALEIAPNSLPAEQGLLETLLADRKAADALAFAKSVQQRRPGDVNGYLFEARVHVYRAAYGKALEVYRATLKRFPITDLATTVHTMLLRAGQPQEAEKFDAQWLSQHPEDFAFLAFVGDSAMARNDFSSAEQYFRRFIQLQPDNPRALNNVAWLMLQQQKSGAVTYAERADRLRANSPELMDTLALALTAEGQTDKALEVQRRAIAIAPNDTALRLTLAKIYVQAGQPGPARTELEALAKLGDKYPRQAEVTQLLKAL